MPLPTKGRKKETTRRPSKKVPNFHLTGVESMEYIKEADPRAKEKTKEAQEMETVKKEAIKAAKRKPRAKPKSPRLGHWR